MDSAHSGSSWHGRRPPEEDHIVVHAWRERDEARAERDRYREALEAVAAYLKGSPQQHRAAGQACGDDACIICLAAGTAEAALDSAASDQSQLDTEDQDGG
jgi:hypothetical protein